MKPAHDDGDPLAPERFGHVHGARKLIGLDADQADEQLGGRRFAPSDNLGKRHFFRGFVEGGDFDGECSEHFACFDVLG